MNVYYDKDIDYIEIFFKKAANYNDSIDEFTSVFRSEKSNAIIGYAFENASKKVFESEHIHITAKLAALLKIVRAHQGITQSEAAKMIGGITLRHYQRLEAGEDTTLEMLEKIALAFPDFDFSKILKPHQSA